MPGKNGVGVCASGIHVYHYMYRWMAMCACVLLVVPCVCSTHAIPQKEPRRKPHRERNMPLYIVSSVIVFIS